MSDYFIQGEEDDLPLWKKFRDISIKEYSKLYAVSVVIQSLSWEQVTHLKKRN